MLVNFPLQRPGQSSCRVVLNRLVVLVVSVAFRTAALAGGGVEDGIGMQVATENLLLASNGIAIRKAAAYWTGQVVMATKWVERNRRNKIKIDQG